MEMGNGEYACAACNANMPADFWAPNIKKCRSCGSGISILPLDPDPEPEEYFRNEALPNHLSNVEGAKKERNHYLGMIAASHSIPEHPHHLDIGCGLGFMLACSKEAGWNPEGVELSPFAAKFATESVGVPVRSGLLQDLAYPSQSFDVITLMDVIEHIPSPLPFLNECRRILHPRGVMLMVTPNFGGVGMRIRKGNAYGMWPDEHVVYLSPGGARVLLKRAGFSRVQVNTRDIYPDNLASFLGRKSDPSLRASFAASGTKSNLRGLANSFLSVIPLGDKLVVLAS